MKAKKNFRLLLVCFTITLLSFTNKKKNVNSSIAGGETGKFWGWGVACTEWVVDLQANEMCRDCREAYFVFWIPVDNDWSTALHQCVHL